MLAMIAMPMGTSARSSLGNWTRLPGILHVTRSSTSEFNHLRHLLLHHEAYPKALRGHREVTLRLHSA